jgi:hypothetical protein
MAVAYDGAVLAKALPAMTRANASLLASGTYFVALDESDSVVACGGWTARQPGATEVQPGLGHIRHFATHPQHVLKGLARAIYDMCEAQAIAAGMEIFSCFASTNALLGWPRRKTMT